MGVIEFHCYWHKFKLWYEESVNICALHGDKTDRVAKLVKWDSEYGEQWFGFQIWCFDCAGFK